MANYEIGTYFRVTLETSAYYGWIGKFIYEIAGQMMIAFDNGDGRAYLEKDLQVVA